MHGRAWYREGECWSENSAMRNIEGPTVHVVVFTNSASPPRWLHMDGAYVLFISQLGSDHLGVKIAAERPPMKKQSRTNQWC